MGCRLITNIWLFRRNFSSQAASNKSSIVSRRRSVGRHLTSLWLQTRRCHSPSSPPSSLSESSSLISTTSGSCRTNHQLINTSSSLSWEVDTPFHQVLLGLDQDSTTAPNHRTISTTRVHISNPGEPDGWAAPPPGRLH